MDNAELKHLVSLYWATKKELDGLSGDLKRAEIEEQLFVELGSAFEKTRDGNAQREWIVKDICNSLFWPERKKNDELKDAASQKIESREVRIKVEYYENKLVVIKKMLGTENVQKLEGYEKENILRREI